MSRRSVGLLAAVVLGSAVVFGAPPFTMAVRASTPASATRSPIAVRNNATSFIIEGVEQSSSHTNQWVIWSSADARTQVTTLAGPVFAVYRSTISLVPCVHAQPACTVAGGGSVAPDDNEAVVSNRGVFPTSHTWAESTQSTDCGTAESCAYLLASPSPVGFLPISVVREQIAHGYLMGARSVIDNTPVVELRPDASASSKVDFLPTEWINPSTDELIQLKFAPDEPPTRYTWQRETTQNAEHLALPIPKGFSRTNDSAARGGFGPYLPANLATTR